MLKIKTLVFNPFDENTYLVWDTDTREAMVIDPGMYNAAERQRFDDFIRENGLTLTHMVNTHLHLDHTWGSGYLRPENRGQQQRQYARCTPPRTGADVRHES